MNNLKGKDWPCVFTGFFSALREHLVLITQKHTHSNTSKESKHFTLSADFPHSVWQFLSEKLWKFNLQSLSIFASLSRHVLLVMCSPALAISSIWKKFSGSFEFLSQVFYSLFRCWPIYLPDTAVINLCAIIFGAVVFEKQIQFLSF